MTHPAIRHRRQSRPMIESVPAWTPSVAVPATSFQLCLDHARPVNLQEQSVSNWSVGQRQRQRQGSHKSSVAREVGDMWFRRSEWWADNHVYRDPLLRRVADLSGVVMWFATVRTPSVYKGVDA